MINEINVFNIQHFSTGDGPGIRTTVFLGGCNLVCPWCHNPEALYGKPKYLSIDEIVSDVMGDIEFYDYSNGGVTISGGEPLCTIDGCIELLKKFREIKINTIIDTALSVDLIDLDKFDLLCTLTDCFFVDLKTTDKNKYLSVCCGDFDVFENNLNNLIARGSNVIFRIPLIPDFNDDIESIENIINFVKRYKLPYTLLPYHRLGTAKYKELGIKYSWENILPHDESFIENIKQKFIDNNLTEADV